MIDDIYSSQLVLQPNVEQEHTFNGITKLVFIENKGFEPAFIYWKNENGVYNTYPAVINRKQNQTLKVKTDVIKVVSKSKTYLDIVSVIGDVEETKGGFYALFDYQATNPFILKSLYVGSFIRNVCVRIVTPFQIGFSMKVGFPANVDEIIMEGQVNCQRSALYEFYPFRISESNETLQITFTGMSNVGQGIIFVEE